MYRYIIFLFIVVRKYNTHYIIILMQEQQADGIFVQQFQFVQALIVAGCL